MSRRAVLLAAVLAASPLARARAYPPAPVPEPPRLVLSATATATAAPDVLAAVLEASAGGADPAAVQRTVDRAATAAVAAAGEVAGVETGLAAYGMNEDDRQRWTGTATLTLRGGDAPALLALVGRLQATGLALTSLDWTLSPATRETAVAQAERRAILALRARAASAADALGLRLAGLVEMRLETPELGFRPRAMGVMRATASPPLAAAPETVEAEVSATLLLAPR